MTANSYDDLDPYLVLYDPVNATVLAVNDDKDNPRGVYNSEIVWTATADQTVWVVAVWHSAQLVQLPGD